MTDGGGLAGDGAHARADQQCLLQKLQPLLQLRDQRIPLPFFHGGQNFLQGENIPGGIGRCKISGVFTEAAAAEQLTVWAQRSGADIVRHEEGSDPAAVVFDGISAGKARGVDTIIIDTAGRLHNKQNLMNELSKMRRIIDRELPGADVETLMVLDATTGQNGLIQAKSFKESADISGIVLTKLDGTARGGIVFAIADELKLPVKFIGVGESADDLMPFEADVFAEEILK